MKKVFSGALVFAFFINVLGCVANLLTTKYMGYPVAAMSSPGGGGTVYRGFGLMILKISSYAASNSLTNTKPLINYSFDAASLAVCFIIAFFIGLIFCFVKSLLTKKQEY